jgi:hypothetical protein
MGLYLHCPVHLHGMKVNGSQEKFWIFKELNTYRVFPNLLNREVNSKPFEISTHV